MTTNLVWINVHIVHMIMRKLWTFNDNNNNVAGKSGKMQHHLSDDAPPAKTTTEHK